MAPRFPFGAQKEVCPLKDETSWSFSPKKNSFSAGHKERLLTRPGLQEDPRLPQLASSCHLRHSSTIFKYIYVKNIYIYLKGPHLPTFQAPYVCLGYQNLKEFFDINYKPAFEALFKKKKKKKKERKTPKQATMCIRDSSLEL